MNNLILSTNHLQLESFFSLKMTCEKSNIYINKSLYLYLNELLSQLQQISSWKSYKHYINLYEILYLDIQNYHLYIYIELFNQYKHIFDEIKYTLHISSNPVESVNALLTMMSSPQHNDDIHHILNSSDIDITNTSYLLDHIQRTNIKYDLIMYDIYDHDLSIDNELTYSKLNLIHILYSLSIQQKNGTFMIKLYDTVQYSTIEMIYLLTCYYETITFYKPSVMDIFTSEKYMICQHFKYENNDFMKLYVNACDMIHTNQYIERIFNFDMSYMFIDKIIEINSIFGQTQIESIKNIIHLILSDNIAKLETIKQYNHKKCIEWCQKNNVMINFSY